MLSLFKDGVDSDASDEEGFLLVIISEKLGKDDDIGICYSGLFDHVAGDVELGAVAVIESKTIK